MKKVYILITILLMIIIAVIIVPYIVVELNTNKYQEEFKNGYRNTGMHDSDEIKYFKVFYVKGNNAKVYYVTDEDGFFVFFTKRNGKWKYKSWDTVWSTNGSADGFTLPYYPH